MQNFGRFSTTSDFDRELPGTGQGIENRKESRAIPSDELWSTTYREFHVSLDPLKCTFWHTIFQPIGVLRPKMFTRAID